MSDRGVGRKISVYSVSGRSSLALDARYLVKLANGFTHQRDDREHHRPEGLSVNLADVRLAEPDKTSCLTTGPGVLQIRFRSCD